MATRKYFTATKRRLRKGLCVSCPRRRDRKDRLQCARCRMKWNRIQKRRYRTVEAAERAKRTIRRCLRTLTRAIGHVAAHAFVAQACV